MARSTDGESVDSKLEPSADAPTPADREGRRAATKELEEAVERLGRAWRVVCSGLGLAICEDPVGGGGKKKVGGAPSCELQTLTAESKVVQIGQKSLLDALSQDASATPNGVKNGGATRKI